MSIKNERQCMRFLELPRHSTAHLDLDNTATVLYSSRCKKQGRDISRDPGRAPSADARLSNQGSTPRE